MKRRILMLLTIMVGAVLQQVLPAWPIFGGIKPPLLACMALHYALRRNVRDMWIAVLTAAVIHDGLDLGPFGPALLAFPVIGILANRIRTEVFSDGLVSLIIFGAVVGLFTTFCTLLIYSVTGLRPFHFGLAVVRLLSAMLLGMISQPLISIAITKMEDPLPKPRGYGWQ